MPAQLVGHLASPDRRSPGRRCPIDRALSAVGSRSALLIMREAVYGTTRFDDFARRVGVSDAVMASRLRELVDLGLLERRPYREPGSRTRHEYVLTASGDEMFPVLLALGEWGRRHTTDGPAPSFTHAGCGAEVEIAVRCADGHDVTTTDDLVVTS